jgi:hypothetical protein
MRHQCPFSSHALQRAAFLQDIVSQGRCAYFRPQRRQRRLYVCNWQIVLQKSFCLTDHKFCGLWARQSNIDVGDYFILRRTHRRLRWRVRDYIDRRLPLVLSFGGKLVARHFATFATLAAMNRHSGKRYRRLFQRAHPPQHHQNGRTMSTRRCVRPNSGRAPRRVTSPSRGEEYRTRRP